MAMITALAMTIKAVNTILAMTILINFSMSYGDHHRWPFVDDECFQRQQTLHKTDKGFPDMWLNLPIDP
jgi:hypothetical protein